MAESERTGVCDVVGAASRVAALAQQHACTLATAESCTGGRVAAAITALAGSSAYFLGGVVSYANSAKVRMLGVPEAILASDGAVSESVACAMADGAREALGADITVATTGIAGPTGGSIEKPVGTVWFATAAASGTKAVCRHFTGDRDRVQFCATLYALELLVGRLVEDVERCK
jgi:nicotinamide-nucleotide amidase